MNEPYAMILLNCFYIIIIYLMMVNIHSKHEYYNEQLQTERENLSRFKEELNELMSYYRYNVSRSDFTCRKCWYPILRLDFNYIFKEPTNFFIISKLFAFICLCISGEFFIKDKPNVYYTLIIGVSILLFSSILLIKILLTLLSITLYQMMRNILTSE